MTVKAVVYVLRNPVGKTCLAIKTMTVSSMVRLFYFGT